jgi:pyruvate/2-oxoglutarate dehydrogenase complex dihydrolipoamide acyltransferase (E2) component
VKTAIYTPELGTGSQSLCISSWLIDIGDEVSSGDRVTELLVKGITFDVPSPTTGVLSQIEKPVDSFTKPGEILGWLDTNSHSPQQVHSGDSE